MIIKFMKIIYESLCNFNFLQIEPGHTCRYFNKKENGTCSKILGTLILNTIFYFHQPCNYVWAWDVLNCIIRKLNYD